MTFLPLTVAQVDTANVLCFKSDGCGTGFIGMVDTPKECCCLDGATTFMRRGTSQCNACADYIDPDGPMVGNACLAL